mmetsp:Transcript_19603/g.47302  ORF Transcript_19603/g.47302 Transcript_19603/m.47302 type:complete len:577 (+) Transcript_19603:91-1821(+)
MFHHLTSCAPMSSSKTAAVMAETTTGERKVDIHKFDSSIPMFEVVQPQQLQHQQPQPQQQKASNSSRQHHRRLLIARLQQQQRRASSRSALQDDQGQQPHQQYHRGLEASGSSSPSPSDEGSKKTQNSASTKNSSSTGSRSVKTQRTGTVTASSKAGAPGVLICHRPPMIDEGMGHYNHGRYDGAIACFRSVMKNKTPKGFGGGEEEEDAVVADYRPFIAQTMTSIGSIYLKQGRLDQASQSLLEALQLIQQLRDGVGYADNGDADDLGGSDEGDDVGMNKYNKTIPMSTVGILNNLGTIALLRQDHDTSLKYYRAALIDARRHLHIHHDGAVDDDHAKDVAKTLHNIGRVLIFQKEWNAALSVLTEALHVEEELCLGSRENEISMPGGMDAKATKRHTIHHVDTLNLIGFVLLELGGPDESLMVFAEVLTIVRGHYGLFHEQVANSLVHVAMAVERQGRLAAARKSYQTALDVFRDLGYDEQGDDPTVLTLIDAIQQIDDELHGDKKVPNSVVVIQEGNSEFITQLCDSMDDSREFDGARCRADEECRYCDSEHDEGIAERQEEYDSFDSRDDEY